MKSTVILNKDGTMWEDGEYSSGNIMCGTFGRMNPITSAHVHLMEQMTIVSGAPTQVVLSESNNDNNPLTFSRRRNIINNLISNNLFVDISSAKDLFEAMDKVYAYAKRMCVWTIVWWGGKDREAAMRRLWLYNEERWPDIELCLAIVDRHKEDGVSATAMREAALNRDYKQFERLSGMSEVDTKEVYNELAAKYEQLNGSVESEAKTA